ncbi:deoxyguanosinetriphosphate triphosphohydrolase [Pseudodesulfovibrio mercurii]|uniref:Deoxyguanosinetriphosphate triphosphohydrolase n=1 Tax=Pseudodesulfovibrio mercurii TaxID=641491 RepID=F0JG20_9BACT|nr:dNTP triphosphohydrolase [Pseudodesulfovibrio mercurii]EGB15016.1 deoxyguanosinetriphosphate triphosphohydrolase [Pseudodesulfovibrio mercurii]
MGSAPRMDWNRLLDATRPKIDKPDKKNKPSKDVRSPFQRDIDRITFSDAFRRLSRKTQVHPLNENDHIHSRLTHSLEVASVGRSLGVHIGNFLQDIGELPEGMQPERVGEIVQAACMAHDIGNPPFGHSGESAIKDWFQGHPGSLTPLPVNCRSDFTKFDGNAMAIRILLNTGFYREGFNPTNAVIGASLKYPWPSSYDVGKDKFSFFQTEAKLVQAAARKLGLIAFGDRFARHPLAFLAEAADDICYRTIDMEDATELGIVSEDFMLKQFAAALEWSPRKAEYKKYARRHYRQRNSSIRTKLIGLATEEVVELFTANHDAIMTGALDPKASLMELSQGVCQTIHSVYKELSDDLFYSRRKAILEIGAGNAISVLLDQIMAEASRVCTDEESTNKEKIIRLLGRDKVEIIKKDKTSCHYKIIMAIVDYISGMTDNYATDLCRKFLGLGY